MVRVYIGGKPHGQGEETTFAQVVADELGLPIENVEIVSGDTESTPQGWGTYGSRTTAVCGIAVFNATRKVKEKAKRIAAHLLEAAEEDLEWRDGKFQVKGTPGRAKSFADVALMANVAWNLPAIEVVALGSGFLQTDGAHARAMAALEEVEALSEELEPNGGAEVAQVAEAAE